MANIWYIQTIRERNRIQPAAARVFETICDSVCFAGPSSSKHTEDEMMILTADTYRDVIVHNIIIIITTELIRDSSYIYDLLYHLLWEWAQRSWVYQVSSPFSQNYSYCSLLLHPWWLLVLSLSLSLSNISQIDDQFSVSLRIHCMHECHIHYLLCMQAHALIMNIGDW